MSAQSPGTVVNAGGKDPDQDKIDKMCEAFKAAITEFCSSAAKGKKFNDLLMKEMQKEKYGDLAKSIEREVPVLMKGAKDVGGTVAATMGGGVAAGVSGEAAGVWNAIKGAYNPLTGAAGIYDAAGKSAGEAMRLSLLNRGGQADGYYRRFLDGSLSGEASATGQARPIEVKGPGDAYHDAQAKDMETISKPNAPIEISCEQCKAQCRSGGGKKSGCKPPAP